MATDPDQDDRIDIDLSDVDPTDELPVLVETAVFESDKHLIAIDEDDEREPTARVLALAPREAEGVEALKKDLEQRATKIEAPESDLARSSGRRLEIERRLAEKDTAISSLTVALEAARSALKERRGVEEGLAAEIADRDNRIARLLDKTDLLRKEAAEARTEAERFRQEREIERREIATLSAELERRASAPAETALREQLDTLTTYIANRRTWWDALESRATVQAARIAELESLVAERTARATTRADAPSAQLAAEARKAESLGTELKRLQKEAAEAASSRDRVAAELERARAETAAVQRERDEARQALSALQQERRGSKPQAPSTSATPDIDAPREQAVDIRAQLEQARADSARLERALAEKERALTARDERLRALQAELQQRLGAIEKASATEVSTANHVAKTPDPERTDVARESAKTPALICLTSDGPRPFALAKGTITIGRSADCDIQILTHFVSREHARLTVSPRGGVLIEDLGSRNGVFVNSVRIERQELRHGDLVTVGESQFRFLETMAH